MTELIREMARAVSGVDDPRYVWADDCVGQYWGARVQAALTAAERLGFVLVPKEATQPMIDRGHALDHLGCDVEYANDVYPRIWEAMVYARPSLDAESKQT